MSPRVALALAVAVAAAGVLATALGGLLTARTLSGMHDSNRIQAGPRVLATIVSTGRPSAHHQPVTLRYQDGAGSAHTLDVSFPLGLAESVIPGMTTSVVYNPASPAKAELAGHPRHSWQDLLIAAGGTLALTGIWLRILLGLLRATGEEAALRRAHVWGSLVVVTALLLAAGRIGAVIAQDHRLQAVGFPPLPPKPSLGGHAEQLPAALSAPPPGRASLVTPAGAHAVIEALWPLRDRLLVERDVVTLRAIERGPALAVDVSRITSGGAPNRFPPSVRAPAELRTYVPRRTRWPVSFLVEAVTTSAGVPHLEVMIVVRRAADAPWQLTFDTGVGAGKGFVPQLMPSHEDGDGYDEVPHLTWLVAEDVVPALARYWQAWLETGKPPLRGPAFSPGTWSDKYVARIAGRQDKRGRNGLPDHVEYGARRAPPSEVWTFGVYGGQELVCSPLVQMDTWTGPAHQDAERQKWGWDLAPGVYRTITSTIVREPCVIVPPFDAPLVVFGADRWDVALRGRRR